MNAFLESVMLLATVVASVTFGILAAYAAVFAVLNSFGRSPQPQLASPRPRLVLVPTQNHVGGD